MNEPHAGVALAFLAVLLATPVLLALLITLSARLGGGAVWVVWAAGFLVFLAIAWPVAADFSVNSEDRIMFTSLIVGTGIATASSAWIVDRKLRSEPTLGLWQLAGYAIFTSIGVMIVVMFISC